MTQEDKNLLLKDICARLPYGVKVQNVLGNSIIDLKERLYCLPSALITNFKPYLRSMSSMTEEEENEYRAINCYEGLFPRNEDALDYVLSHHLDFRGLIPMGLALEAPEGMYKTE